MRLGQVRMAGAIENLGTGQMSSPVVSPASLAAIRAMADATLDELEAQLENVGLDEAAVEPSTVELDPGRANGIPEVGSLDVREIRSVISADAVALKEAANRLSSGSAASYLDPAQMSRARAASNNAQGIVTYLLSLETAPIASKDQDAAAAHLANRMDGVDHDVSRLEQAIVTAEAGSVPVVEPYERTSQAMTVVATIGGIGLVIFLITKIF